MLARSAWQRSGYEAIFPCFRFARCFLSSSRNSPIGGIAILISKTILPDGPLPALVVHILGRIMHIPILYSAEQQLNIWNIHDFPLDTQANLNTRRIIGELVEPARQKPLQYVISLKGDLNRTREGDMRFFILTPSINMTMPPPHLLITPIILLLIGRGTVVLLP